MRCWRCDKDNSDGVQKCLHCGISQSRTSPVTEIGKVFRMLYDDCGCEKIFEDSRYLTAPLSDFIPDSELLKRNIDLVFYVGLGKIYASQLQKQGKPDEDFYKRVKRIITEEADLSDRKAVQLISLFDEMIGWNEAKPVETSSVQTSQEKTESTVVKDTIDEIEGFTEPEYFSDNSTEDSVIPAGVFKPLNNQTRPGLKIQSYNQQKASSAVKRPKKTEFSEMKTTGDFANSERDKLLERKVSQYTPQQRTDSKSIQISKPFEEIEAERKKYIIGIVIGIGILLIFLIISI